MNEGAARACRADRRISKLGGKIPRSMKRAWVRLSHRQKAKLRRHWRAAQHDLGVIGEFKQDLQNKKHLEKTIAKATVSSVELKL